MKKNIIYYSLLVVLWVVIVMLLAVLFIMIGIMPARFSYAYSFGDACGHPQLWMMAIGIVLLLRPAVWKYVTKTNKQFRKTNAVLFLIIGFVWLLLNVGSRMMEKHITETYLEHYEP